MQSLPLAIQRDFYMTSGVRRSKRSAFRLNDTVLLADGYARTAERLEACDLRVRLMSVAEIAKLDAGLSCVSLRW